MDFRSFLGLLLPSLAVLFVINSSPAYCADDDSKKVVTTDSANDPAFHKVLLEIAAEYKRYSQVNPTSKYAPALCALPAPPKHPQISASSDSSTHGRKVYYLFAKNLFAYTNLENPDVAQSLVKESWTPKKIKNPDGSDQVVEDKMYGLFIMTKLEGNPKGTDNGWVYGNVSPDARTVTSSGRVASCMGCHQEAPHGRLFGINSKK